FMDVLSMQVATIPITYPIATALGVDPIWFGIFIVLMCELGMITPPVGMNLFVVHGIGPDKGGIEDAIRGALPYALIMILFTLLRSADAVGPSAGPRFDALRSKLRRRARAAAMTDRRGATAPCRKSKELSPCPRPLSR
ncbi:MAG: TRAP transporter large permease subunit, partial [Caldimonas sp.]